MSEESYEVVLSGGGPFGFRLQGGKEFGRGLAIQSITAGGKADSRGICSGDSLTAINGQTTEGMTHLEAQNTIKRSQTLKLNLKRKPGNIATSMGKKDAVVTVETTNSAKVDYKYNSRPKPFGGAAKSTPAPAKSPTPKPAPPVEKKEDNLEDSEVLKMLRNSNLSEESTGLRRTGQGRRISRGSENSDDLPPPPPEAFVEEEVGPQSRTFRLLEKSINSGEDHPSALSRPSANPPTTTRISAPKPYSPPSHSRPPQTIAVQTGAPPAPAHNKPAKSYGGNPPPPAPSAPVSRPPQTAPAAPRPSAPPQKKAGTPSCEYCGEVIQGPFVSALGRNWHPDHFRCGGCECSLQNIGFVEEGGSMFCENCYNQRFAPKCASCNQPIVGVSVKALGKVYHQDHFTCTHCGKQLAGEGFHVENGVPYCSQDYKELFCVKCFSCKQIIRAGDRWMEAVNQKWHADCFRCMNCGIVLENTGFYSTGNRVFCPQHA